MAEPVPVPQNYSLGKPVPQGYSVGAPTQAAATEQQPPSAMGRFWEGLKGETGNIVKNQANAWTHGNMVGEDSGTASGNPETFNPFHPVDTAGYLVPQPVKDIYQQIKEGNLAGAAGKAIPLAATNIPIEPGAVRPAAEAAWRGTSKGINTGLDYAPGVGSAVGAYLGGHVDPGVTGPAVGGIVGNLAGRVVSKIPRVPGETLGLPDLPESTAAIPASAYKTISQANPALNDAQIRAVYQDHLKAMPQRPARVQLAEQPKPVQEAVSPVIDSKIPDGPINEAAKEVAGSALAAGDAEHAQAVVNAAEELAKTVPAQAQRSLKWEDILDDTAWKQRMEDELSSQQDASWRYKSRLQRAGSSADSNKGSLMTPEQVVQSMPAPAGTMEANQMLGYQGRRTVPQATAVRNQALAGKPTAALKDFVRMYYGDEGDLKIRPTQ